MDEFVTEFSKNPHKWRSRLTEDQQEKIKTFVNNIADVTPKTDKLALEARIIARRHPHIAVVQDEEDEVETASPVIIWPPKKIHNKMVFFKWMWTNNRAYMINKYMTSEYEAEHIVGLLPLHSDLTKEADLVWRKHVRTNNVLMDAIFDLLDEHHAKFRGLQVEDEEVSADEELPVNPPPVAKESESDEESESPKPLKKQPSYFSAVKAARVLTKKAAPVKKAAPAKQDSEGEEVYSDEANYESDESEETVPKNNDYIPKADSESE